MKLLRNTFYDHSNSDPVQKTLLFTNLSGIFSDPNQPMMYSFSDPMLTYDKYLLSSSPSHFIQRLFDKMVAIPSALAIGLIKATYNLGIAALLKIALLFSENTQTREKSTYYRYYALRDCEEGFGRFLSLFHYSLGRYFIEHAQFEKECYDVYLSKEFNASDFSGLSPGLFPFNYNAINSENLQRLFPLDNPTTRERLKTLSNENLQFFIRHLSKEYMSLIPIERINDLNFIQLSEEKICALFGIESSPPVIAKPIFKKHFLLLNADNMHQVIARFQRMGINLDQILTQAFPIDDADTPKNINQLPSNILSLFTPHFTEMHLRMLSDSSIASLDYSKLTSQKILSLLQLESAAPDASRINTILEALSTENVSPIILCLKSTIGMSKEHYSLLFKHSSHSLVEKRFKEVQKDTEVWNFLKAKFPLELLRDASLNSDDANDLIKRLLEKPMTPKQIFDEALEGISMPSKLSALTMENLRLFQPFFTKANLETFPVEIINKLDFSKLTQEEIECLLRIKKKENGVYTLDIAYLNEILRALTIEDVNPIIHCLKNATETNVIESLLYGVLLHTASLSLQEKRMTCVQNDSVIWDTLKRTIGISLLTHQFINAEKLNDLISHLSRKKITPRDIYNCISVGRNKHDFHKRLNMLNEENLHFLLPSFKETDYLALNIETIIKFNFSKLQPLDILHLLGYTWIISRKEYYYYPNDERRLSIFRALTTEDLSPILRALLVTSYAMGKEDYDALFPSTHPLTKRRLLLLKNIPAIWDLLNEHFRENIRRELPETAAAAGGAGASAAGRAAAHPPAAAPIPAKYRLLLDTGAATLSEATLEKLYNDRKSLLNKDKTLTPAEIGNILGLDLTTVSELTSEILGRIWASLVDLRSKKPRQREGELNSDFRKRQEEFDQHNKLLLSLFFQLTSSITHTYRQQRIEQPDIPRYLKETYPGEATLANAHLILGIPLSINDPDLIRTIASRLRKEYHSDRIKRVATESEEAYKARVDEATAEYSLITDALEFLNERYTTP